MTAAEIEVTPTTVILLEGFGLDATPAARRLSRGSQRLIAFLALRAVSVRRDLAAGMLWPLVTEVRAHANLRAALSRLGPAGRDTVVAGAEDVALVDGVVVDLHQAQSLARHLMVPANSLDAAAVPPAIAALSASLLPGWYEDWALLAAENWHQLRLHALETLASSLAGTGQFGYAADAAGAAVSADPLRESARRALIGVHMVEGNQSEALREFERYRHLLRVDLGLEPTLRLRALLPASHKP